jgi:peptide/nickel transport system permease protein
MPAADRIVTGRLAPFVAATPARARGSLVGRVDPFAVVGSIIYAVVGIVAIFANQLATHDPFQILFLPEGGLAANLPISGEHYLGTTNMGRDIYSQLILGTRSAILVGLAAAFVVVVIGTLVGLLSGFFGGLVDMVLMRAADVALGIPFLPFVIVLAGFLEPSLWNVVLAMALLVWPTTGRVIRSQVLTLRERAFVDAARVSGASEMRILFVHVMPNILPLSLVYGSISIGWAILTEASVSFLGFGATDTISWGYMLQDAYVSQALSRGWYRWFVPPGICIVLIVVAGFFISRGFEEVFFPRLRD